MPLFRLWKSLWQIVPSQSPPKDTYRSVSIPAKCIAVSQIQCKHRDIYAFAHFGHTVFRTSSVFTWWDNCCVAVIFFIKHALTLTSSFNGNKLLFDVNLGTPTMRKLYGKQQQFFSPQCLAYMSQLNTHMPSFQFQVQSTLLARLFCLQYCQRINTPNKTVTEKINK